MLDLDINPRVRDIIKAALKQAELVWMRKAKTESVRLMAADRIITALSVRLPMNIDVSALCHEEIVYESAQQLREELQRRGVPSVLIEHMGDVTPSQTDPDRDE
jgi:hypothetical protein